MPVTPPPNTSPDAPIFSYLLLVRPELQKFINAAMAKHWVMYPEIVEILFMNNHALCTQDWDSF